MPSPDNGNGDQFEKEFPLDPKILGPGSALKVSVGGATDADVLQAILKNTAFPTRPNGQLPLGSIDLQASGGNQIAFKAGPSGTVTFQFAASFHAGIGVFDKPADALGSLSLDSAPNLDLTIPGDQASRYLLMVLGYKASGSFTESSPIGAVGSVTFGAQASGDQLFAVLHGFPADTGADTALRDTVVSWRLPRHVASPNDLKPGTWIIAQTNGSVALNIAAQLGYDFNFVRQANLLGMPRSLGVKIDAGLKATFGFNASGQFLVVVGREKDDGVVRLRLFKQKDLGFNFGLNLNVGVTGQADLPPTIDDFVQAVFGVHGQQVLNDLHLIEQWTDPTKDLGDTVARLINKTGLDLLTKATGIDAAAEFEKARQLVLGAFQKWDALPSRVSTAVWKILGKAAPGAVDEFKTFLTALADPNPDSRSQALAQALAQVAFGDSPQGQFLESIAEQGLLALSSQLDKVQKIASQTLNILNGGIIKNIQDFISQHLDLDQIRKVVTENDFNTVDEWLIKRLSDFLDQKLDFAALKPIQTAISTVIQKASDIYKKAIDALNNTYNFNFAATYQRNTTDTALLDVNFDLSNAQAAQLFQQVATASRLDDLLVKVVPGVTLNQASLSHEIKRQGEVAVHMPFFDFSTQHINDSVASVTALNAEHDSGRVLVYQGNATDVVTSPSRFQSQLSVMGKLRVVNGQLQADALADSSVSYQSLQVKTGMTQGELKFRTMPFLRGLLGNVFSDDESIDRFYTALNQTMSDATGNQSNFGDAALNFQIALPAAVLAAWFQPLDSSSVSKASLQMSLALQAKLREMVPVHFFQDLAALGQNPTAAALLVWSGMPVANSLSLDDDGGLQFGTKSVFWDVERPELRKAMIFDKRTSNALLAALEVARGRLLDASNKHQASLFGPDQAGAFQELAASQAGDILVHNLLSTEAVMVEGAASALKDVQKALVVLATAPSQAIRRLADFGAALSSTFNKNLTVYSRPETMRTLNSLLLVEASKALNPAMLAATPAAMLSMAVLKQGHTFQLNDYLTGKLPPQEEVAVAQTLTNLGAGGNVLAVGASA
jgi:hypothetical protein